MGILQASILEWVAMRFSRGSSQPRSLILQAESLPSEPPGKSKNTGVGSLSFSRVSSLLRNLTGVSCIAGRFFTSWATREALNFSPIGGYLGYSQFHGSTLNQASMLGGFFWVWTVLMRVHFLKLGTLQSLSHESWNSHKAGYKTKILWKPERISGEFQTI